MSDFTLLEVHFHEFNPTNTAPLIDRGDASQEGGRGDADLDGVPVEEAETGTKSASASESRFEVGDVSEGDTESADDGSGGPGLGLVAALFVLVATAVAARKFFGGDDEFDELAEIDDVA